MAIIRSKGTLLKLSIASVMTTIAQVPMLDLPEASNETFEADYLDNTAAGIPHKATGRTEGGEIGFELWFDPVLATHQAITDLLTTPASAGTAGKIVFADGAATEWGFTAAGVTLGGAVQLKEGLKAKGKLKLDGIVTYPT